MRIRSFLFTLTISLALLPLGGMSNAQQTRSRTDDNAFMKAGPVKSAMERLEKAADHFEDAFESALDRSSYNGGHTEDTLLRWADMFEDEVDNMAEDFKENDTNEYIDHFENAMIVGAAINRAMLRRDFAAHADVAWSAIRADLNHIAMQMHRPPLPNVTVITITPATPALMVKVDVKQALEHIEAGTDRFEKKLRDSLHSSTANMTARERVWNQWADYLEDTSDDMLEEYKENDPKEFQKELERTLMVAEAINRVMLRSDLFADAELEWRNLRNHLNVIASGFGYPALSGAKTGA
jgi:hypothetical protein